MPPPRSTVLPLVPPPSEGSGAAEPVDPRTLLGLQAQIATQRAVLAALQQDTEQALAQLIAVHVPAGPGRDAATSARPPAASAEPPAAQDRDELSALQARHERQTRFLTLLAHELRNPLAVIRAASVVLGRVRSDEPHLPRMRNIIETQVVQMARFVDDLLDVGRASNGKLRLALRPMDLCALVADVADSCRPAMQARSQRFALTLPAGPLAVTGDPVRLTQVLSNLLDNASKYTPSGGEVGLEVAVADHEVVVSVVDSGIGITAEALPEVFEPFVQDAHAVGFNGAGLGLGLTVVRELVQGHGGSVVVTSAGKDRGSRFVVTLPLSSAPGAAA